MAKTQRGSGLITGGTVAGATGFLGFLYEVAVYGTFMEISLAPIFFLLFCGGAGATLAGLRVSISPCIPDIREFMLPADAYQRLRRDEIILDTVMLVGIIAGSVGVVFFLGAAFKMFDGNITMGAWIYAHQPLVMIVSGLLGIVGLGGGWLVIIRPPLSADKYK